MENNSTQTQRLTVVDCQIYNSAGQLIATYTSHLEAFKALCLATRS